MILSPGAGGLGPGGPPSGGPKPMAPKSFQITITSFEADPRGWFDWLRGELVNGRLAIVLPTVAPATWRNDDAHGWRVVRTAVGIEVRPELESPFIRYGESPKVTALGISPTALTVELTCRTGRWVDRFPIDAFDIASLGQAMLAERALPHDNLGKLFPPSEI